MLRRDRQLRVQVHQIMDGFLFAASFWFAYALRADPRVQYHFGLEHFNLDPAIAYQRLGWLYALLVFISPLVLEAQGFYANPPLCRRRVLYWQILKSSFFMTFGVILVLYFNKLLVEGIARWIPIWFCGISFTALAIKQEFIRSLARGQVSQKEHARRFVLLGTSGEVASVRKLIEARPEERIKLVAELDLNRASIKDLVQILHEHSVNGVIISARHTFFDRVEEAIRACELEGVEAWLVADFFKTQISRTSFDDFYGHPVMVFRSTPDASWEGVMKKVLDGLGALILLLFAAIPLAIVALMVKFSSCGPILFKQQRAGLNGRPFTMYKFRTMATDAEQRKHELAAMNEMKGPVFKVTNDPRVTSIGKWLRKYSIDEMPQLFNVLRGDMSLVGPRPLPIDEVKRFDDFAHRRRLSVKPGLTCLWQISGRNNVTDFKDWVRLDLEYIDNWSLWLDLKILVRTIPAVLAGAGAK